MSKINLHLISDSTGETLSAISRAVISQFRGLESQDFIWPLVRSEEQLNVVLNSISKNPGIVLHTILEDKLIDKLVNFCSKLHIPCISALSTILSEFSNYLEIDITNSIGRQHILDKQYFLKVEAINYAINHDDGQNTQDLYKADVILIGVSRTSKSPTSIYLSCRGYKAANIPFVNIQVFPDNIFNLKNPIIIGLTIDPEKLSQIRKNRLYSMSDSNNLKYTDLSLIKKEIIDSKKLFAKLKCPIVDVTESSVEETAAKIIQLLNKKKNL